MAPPLPTANARRQAPEKVRMRVAVYDALAAAAGADTVTAQAELHGLDRTTMHALKAGTNEPRLSTAMRIAADLGVRIEALWERIS